MHATYSLQMWVVREFFDVTAKVKKTSIVLVPRTTLVLQVANTKNCFVPVRSTSSLLKLSGSCYFVVGRKLCTRYVSFEKNTNSWPHLGCASLHLLRTKRFQNPYAACSIRPSSSTPPGRGAQLEATESSALNLRFKKRSDGKNRPSCVVTTAGSMTMLWAS